MYNLNKRIKPLSYILYLNFKQLINDLDSPNLKYLVISINWSQSDLNSPHVVQNI